MTLTLRPVYHAACPNCGGPISAVRLVEGLPCVQCLPTVGELSTDYYERIETIGRLLAENGRLRGYWYLYSSTSQLREFEEFFEKLTGHKLWSAQRTWAKRMLQGESIAIVAPTGVGKTTLLSVYAVYRASQGLKVYYLLPTENLARQVTRKLETLSSRLGGGIRVVSYYSSLPKRAKEESLRTIEERSYDILVTTTAFLSRRWSLIEGIRFDSILVDDVDAVLRNSKNIDKLLQALGFSVEAIEAAYNLVKKKIMATIAKTSGNIKRYEKLLQDIEQLEAILSQELVKTTPGQLVIASATGRAYGLKPKLFRELLGFDIGRVYDYTRSIANLYKIVNDPVAEAVSLVTRMGGGGLVFVAKRFGKNVARRIAEMLNERGIRAAVALAGRRVLDRFASGEYDVLVGVASYYGVIVRGIDMPERIHYTVFVGVPSQAIEAGKALLSPHRIARSAVELSLEGAEELARRLSKLAPNEVTVLRIALERGERLEGRLGEILEMLLETRRKLLHAIEELVSIEGSVAVGGALYRFEDGKLVAILPDAPTYVQASGRASRMYGSAMTHGISIVLDVDEILVRLLAEKLKRFLEDVRFEELSSEKLAKELEKARASRRGGVGKKVDIETCLIVVESPTKAKTIAGFFGRPVRRRIGSVVVYETTFYNPVSGKIHVAAIAATAGHVYDLTIDDEGIYGVELGKNGVSPIYKPIKRCLSCGHQFSSSSQVCPRCGSSNIVSKEDVIGALRQLAIENEVVYIATDPDVEGEKIAYDIYLLLRPYARKIMRIELHEITRSELNRALANPREVDVRLAEAQMVRRIEDRWIGFGLSQHLWQVFGKNWLGAGRVQTPVLGWIIERYSEWRSNLGYNLYIRLPGGPLVKIHYDSASGAREAAAAAENGVRVVSVEEEVVEINPPPPYTTESLIYDASRLYGYPAQKTMRVAQELFEAGLITYHRTDSTHVSGLGQHIARLYLESREDAELLQPRSWGPQGHHEAIRPTRPIDAEALRRMVALGDLRVPVTLRESHYRLYDLIFRRFIASQMKPAKLKRRRIRLEVAGSQVEIEVYTAALREGYHKYYPYPRLHMALDSVKPGDVLRPERILVRRGSTVYLYTHGEIVSLMRERGLGRPSTYAKIIDALERHGYVIESKYRRRLVPTKLGIEVYEYLESRYGSLVSEERTRKLYRDIEEIASGNKSPVEVVNELLAELSELLETSLRQYTGEVKALG
ncbi:reverse gyrase [Hyperthermus butylicus]|uniref:reverse gyrase n=1 Tax=Hyperthermus butylicus TaxID=54248 RepID=UPI001891598F|nr:reverse gyrase [Hyperthermus butylicus]